MVKAARIRDRALNHGTFVRLLQVGKALTESWYHEQLESHGRPMVRETMRGEGWHREPHGRPMVRETMGGGGLVPRAARVTRQANGA